MDPNMVAPNRQICIVENGKTLRAYGVTVLFFSGLWGLSEAILGNALYSAGVRYASIPLTVVGFGVLTLARGYFPQMGTATLIASCAMLYKFLNAPFFACHMLGILLIGLCCDAFFSVLRIRRTWLAVGLATYANYATFALMITYVARYEHWVNGGLIKILRHVGIDGSMAAIAGAVVVPLVVRLGERLRRIAPAPLALQGSPISWAVTGLTAGFWVLGTATYLAGRAWGG